MPARTLKLTLLVLVFCCMITPAALALTIIPASPDWTIQVSGGSYGIQGYRSSTCFCWGSHHYYVSLPFSSVVAIGSVLTLVVCFAGVRLASRRR
jgi:hypothetical protein